MTKRFLIFLTALAACVLVLGFAVGQNAEAMSGPQSAKRLAAWIVSKPGPCGDGTTIRCKGIHQKVCYARLNPGWLCSVVYEESKHLVSYRFCSGTAVMQNGLVQSYSGDDCHPKSKRGTVPG